jgi:Peptidase family C25
MKKAGSPLTTKLNVRLLALFAAIALGVATLTVTAFMQNQAPAKAPGPDTAVGSETNPPKEKKSEESTKSNPDVVPNAINAGTYAFTSSSGAVLEDMSSGTTMLLTPDLDDAASSIAPIGFDFWFDGTRQTQFSVNANGLMKLSSTPVTTAFTNDLASATNVPQIAAYWDDLWLGNNGKAHYKVVGTAPNRKLVVEWQNEQIPRVAAATSGAGTFQAWLYESTGKIEFVYGSGVGANSTNGGYSVGFGSSATQFASVTTSGPTAAYGVANNANTGAITSGTKYTFTPNIPTDPGALSFTAVGLNTMTLNWADNATNEFGYVVYRSLDGTNYEFVRQLAAGSTSSVEGGIASNTTYSWRVFAVTEGGLSNASSGSRATATGTLSGTRTIGPTGNYLTIGAAVTDINTNGLAGNLILELQSTYLSTVETFPLTINTLGSPSNTITLRPATGATALSISSAAVTQTLNLNGATNLTIDGRAGGTGASQLTIANTATAGVPIQFINDAVRNTIQFATVQGVNTSATGGDIVFSTTTGSLGNSNNTIDNCDIKDGATTPANCIFSLGTGAAPNSNNTVSNNNIHDYFIVSTTATNGILLSSASGNLSNIRWTISNNKFYQSVTRTYTTTGAIHAAISIGANTAAITTGYGHTITGNTIGFAAANGTGTYTMAGTIATRFIGINLNVGAEPTSVQNNTIAGFSLATSSGATTTNGIWSGINVLQGNVNIGTTTGNTIGSGTGTGSITATSSTTLGLVVGISVHTNASVAAINISNNTIGSITNNGSGSISGIQISQGQPTITSNTIGSNATALSINSPTVAAVSTQLNGVNIQTGTAPAGVVAPTTISSNTIANISGAGTGTTAVARGITNSSTGPATIASNTIHDIASASTNTTVAGGGTAVQGILQTGAAALGASVDQNTVFTISATNATAVSTVVAGIGYSNPTNGTVTKNKIYDLRNASTGTTATAPPMAIGLLIRAALGAGGTFANNMISLGTAQTTNTQFVGMMNSFVTAGVFAYYNSVHIAGTAASGALPSFGFLRGDNSAASAITTPVDIRNNILNNTRTGGTGKHYAIGNVNGTPATGWGTNASNFNVLNSASAATVGIWGLATDETFANWKIASASDASSLSGVTVTFVDAANGNLHLNFGTTPTPIESGGTAIAGLTIDFDMQTRPGPPGSVNGGAIAPDIGADEFDGVPQDITAPSITYTPLANTTLTTNRMLNAMITDAGGIAGGANAPRIYYRKNGGSYVSTQSGAPSGSVYPFTIDYSLVGGVTAGDVIDYFVIAQDNAGNVASNPGGVVATNVNTVTTPPAVPNSYMIVAAFASSVNVGASEAITSLTNPGGLFAQMNSAVLTSNVTINLTSDLTGETGSIALNQWTEEGAGNYTVTLKPSGVARSITSTATAVSVIKINDADRFTIDGSLSGGTDRSLSITNINTAASTAVIWVASATNGATNNTIKNTILTGGADQSTGTNFNFGIISSSSAAILTGGADNDNNTYSNNLVKKASVGIASLAGLATNPNQSTTISNNQVGPAAFGTDEIGTCGILLFNENAANVINNEIRFVGDLALTGGGSGRDRVGIEIGSTSGNWSSTTAGTSVLVTNSNIKGNLIHDIVDRATFSAVGIVENATNSGSATANTIANNMIYNIVANGTSPDQGVGIGISNGSGDKVVYNSVYLTGDIDPAGATSADRGTFGISVISTAVANLDLRDNISVIDVNSNTAALLHAAINIPASFSWGTGGSNFNDWFAPAANTQARVGCVGNTPSGTFHATLAAWQTATTQDANSISADPLFTSATDLHLPATSPALSVGTPVVGVTNDFDNDPRPASNPDMGADELVMATAGIIAAGTYYNASANDGDTLSGNVTITNTLTLNGKLSTGANTLTIGCNAMIVGAGAGNYVIGNLRKTYCSAGSFNFVVGTANGFSPVMVNITAGTFPADFTVKAVQGPQPNIATPTRALQRYWVLTATGVTADLTFNYLDPTDIPAGATEANFVIFKYNGTFTMPGGSVNTVANTASITGVTSFSDWTLAEPNAPTDIALKGFTVEGLAASPSAPQGGVLLRWQTGFEVANLGFNLYRDDAGRRTRINPNLVAGSAFFVGANTVLGAGRSYVWRDTQGINPAAQYWLEEKDLNGNSFWHGPVMLSSAGKLAADSFEPNARLLNDLGDDQNADTATHTVERFATQRRVTAAAAATQQALVSNSTIKITVNRESWYQIKVADLIAAGLDGRTNPQFLQLFVDGREQPINVTTNKDGSLTGIEFYGTGVDNPYTRERAYFLLVGASAGKRIPKVTSNGNPVPGGSFLATVERRDRSLYFSALRNGERENFFGAVIHEPVDQTLTLARVNSSAATAATLEVTLQGATNQAHSVRVELNGSPVGTLSFANQASAVASFNVAHALLREGANTVRLVPMGGPGDVALVDSLRLSYQHYNTADGEALRLTATGQQAVTIDGFSKPAIRVLDITDAGAVQELVGVVQSQKSGSSVSLLVPGTGQRTLLALASDLASPVSVVASANSSWRQPLNGADLVVITRKEFAVALDPLVTLRQKQGLSVAVVDIDAVYNEFSFGQKTPQAVKDFLSYAATSWKKKPRYVLLAADASYDPKGYLGLGNSDLVPTKLFDTQYMETACDDYFVDFNNDGVPELAIGRLPARTANEALTMAAKIARYNSQPPADSLLLVNDLSDTFDFTSASESLRALIPPDVRVQSLHRGDVDDATMHARLLAAINNGQRLVNYVGHGSSDLWRGSLLTSADVSSLTNSDRLTIFVMMTCLNGYYIDPAAGSLGKDLLKSERGGAVAVWASSGMTLPDAQAVMNQEAYRQMFSSQGLTIGEAMKQAKVAVTNGDVRRTWILLGDPTMKLR